MNVLRTLLLAVIGLGVCRSAIAADPPQAIVLLDPAQAAAKQDVADFLKKNGLLFMASSIEVKDREYYAAPAKIDVEVGTPKTFKGGKYILELGKPVPDQAGADYYYPFALHYRNPTKPKLIQLTGEAIKFAHWREPVPTQLPRLFNTAIPISLRYYLPPLFMPAGGTLSQGDRMANLSREPLPTQFPAKTGMRDGANISQAELHNRLPVKIAACLELRGGGIKYETMPQVVGPGEKLPVSVNTETHVMSWFRVSNFYIVDEELEPMKFE